MMLRFVLIFTVFSATVTMVMAEPPRFSAYGDSTTHKDRPKAKKGQANNVPSPSNAKTAAGTATKEAASKSSKPSAKKNTQSKDATQTAKPEEKESWLQRLIKKHQKPKIKEKTHKQDDKLVTTYPHHPRTSESLGRADFHRYGPDYQAQWKVKSSKILCSMKQQIPHYGYVEFSEGVAKPLQFALYVKFPPAGVGKAHIRTEPPRWQHYVRPKDLGVIEVEPGKQAVKASSDWSRRLLLELSEGMQPVMRYWDAADASDDMEVVISAFNFRQSLDRFQHCLGKMVRYDFAAVKRSTVYFHADSSRLRQKAKKQLDKLIAIVKRDPGIKRIRLELYTQNRTGLVRYNFRLATRRARAVRDYLIKRGLSEDKLLINMYTKSRSAMKKLGYKDTNVYLVLERSGK